MKKLFLLLSLCFIGTIAGVAQNYIRIINGDTERVVNLATIDSLTIRPANYYVTDEPTPGPSNPGTEGEFVNCVASSSGLVVMANYHFIKASQNAEVKFAVRDQNGADVTSAATIYLVEGETNTALSGNTFVCENAGTYNFIVTYNTKNTKDAPLTVTAVNNIPEVEADSNPASTDFLRNALIVQGTGVACQYCPNALEALSGFFANNAYADQAYLMALHTFTSGDPLYSEAAQTLSTRAGITNYPTLKINFDNSMYKSGVSSTEFSNFLNTNIPNICSKTAETAIAVSTTYDEATGTISVAAKVKCDNPNTYKVSVVLVQDNVFYPQTGTTNTKFYTHEAGVKDIAPATGAGYALNNGAHTVSGASYDFCCEFNKDALYAKGTGAFALDVLRDARVLVYVQANGQLVDNVVSCGMNQKVGFTYKQ